MDDGTDELLAEFLVESLENLDQLDQDLVALERAPDDAEILQRIFRAFHTIKGTCGFLDYTTLESLTHAAEALLVQLRDGGRAYDPAVADALLRATDGVRDLLAVIEATGSEGEADHDDLIAMLAAVAATRPAPAADVVGAPDPAPLLGEMLVERGETTPADVAIGLVRQQELGDERPLGEILVEAGAVEPAAVTNALGEQHRVRSGESTLRVDVGLLDALVTLVGELVLTRNQIRQLVAHTGDSDALAAATQRLNTVTSELQGQVMKTRMQPIGSVWSKLPRVVRDLAVQCGKQVRVEMDGEDTELDKAVIEAIKDPLTHMVRNAIDHGVETPDERRSAGKPAEGVLRLHAYHESGEVHIEIADDGRGLDLERLKAKAVTDGVLAGAHAAHLSDREATELIFRPGLSTAAQVSNLSGRGVGMDVVRTNIEGLGGSVECESRLGVGSTFKIRIPLTLAIVPALVVRSGGERFAVPYANLVELVGVGEESEAAIESVQGAPVYRLRDRMLPIVFLNDELRLDPSDAHRRPTIVVLRTDGRREFGLVVDEVVDTEEIVVKPLPPHFERVRAFSGCTIMGDGSIALIVDVQAIADRAGLHGEGRMPRAGDAAAPADGIRTAAATLVVRTGAQSRAAIGLDNVERLAVFQQAQLETAAGHPVVQYRGVLLPLLDLAALVGARAGAGAGERRDELSVVVYTDDSRSVGLIIEDVVDIVAEPLAEVEVAGRAGVRASAVIAGAVTDLLDVAALIGTMPDSFAALVRAARDGETVDA